MTDFVSQAEFDLLVRRLDASDRRMDQIDQGGTRGVGVLALQIQELTKDFVTHEQLHSRERLERSTMRKWLIATLIGLVGAIDGPIVAVLLAVHGGH